MNAIPLRIAYIGGGSREWARKLMFDLALSPDLTGEVRLYDIDVESAVLNERFGNWLQEQAGVVSRWNYHVCKELSEALVGADFVIISIQPGSLEVMAEEIAIAEKYGLFFPVGDTTGAPGLIRGLRAAATYQGFAEKIAAICPKAWVINYTNPMSICTRTLNRVVPEINVIGCCHEVFAVKRMLADLVAKYWNVATPAISEIEAEVTGINHFTWFTKAVWNGRDLFDLIRHHMDQPGTMRQYSQQEVESWNDYWKCVHQIKYAFFERFGILPAAGDRHLVEFLPAYIQSPELLFSWGVIRTPISYRIERWKTAPQRTHDIMIRKTPLTLQTSGEEGVKQIKALLGLGDLVTNVNFKNQGQVPALPLGAVVETNAVIEKGSVRPINAASLPNSLQPLISRHVMNQELIIDALLSRNLDPAFQAVYLDPANSLTIDKTWSMFNELVEVNQPYLDFIS